MLVMRGVTRLVRDDNLVSKRTAAAPMSQLLGATERIDATMCALQGTPGSWTGKRVR
jgi:hypothetical protein